jgi:peptidoglycan-associated lipoprotein
MIPVQRGPDGWVNSRTTFATAMAIASVVVMLAMTGCSSKKPVPIGPETNSNPNALNENSSAGSQTKEDWEKGTVGRGGPLSDIHFGYNDYTIQEQDGSVLKSNASWLQAHPQTRVQVEGFCDDRGSEEYNMALGAKRAQSAKDYLVTLGIGGDRISTISYGKELPLCDEHEESCWAQNRRDHFGVNQ